MPFVFWIFLAPVILFLLGTGSCYLWISIVAAPYIYSDTQHLPSRKTALLLGTAKFTREGRLNAYFIRRIAKAIRVYNLRKVEHILISGADKLPYMKDEVDFMYQNLLAERIPPGALIKDHKGSRTWNSLWRCKKVYGITDPLIISQHFHNQRAVFIGLKMGMHPIAINASKVGGKAGLRMFLRECMARIKCLMDCYWLKPQPH